MSDNLKAGDMVKFCESYLQSLPSCYEYYIPQMREKIYKIREITDKQYVLEGWGGVMFEHGGIKSLQLYIPK